MVLYRGSTASRDGVHGNGFNSNTLSTGLLWSVNSVSVSVLYFCVHLVQGNSCVCVPCMCPVFFVHLVQGNSCVCVPCVCAVCVSGIFSRPCKGCIVICVCVCCLCLSCTFSRSCAIRIVCVCVSVYVSPSTFATLKQFQHLREL